jgi:hypothetical protein
MLAELHAAIDELEKNVQPTWKGLVEPLERIGDKHSRTWGIVSHLKVGPASGPAAASLPGPAGRCQSAGGLVCTPGPSA